MARRYNDDSKNMNMNLNWDTDMDKEANMDKDTKTDMDADWTWIFRTSGLSAIGLKRQLAVTQRQICSLI